MPTLKMEMMCVLTKSCRILDINPTFDDEIAERLFIDDQEEKRFCSDATEGTTIPCTDEKVMMLYDAALATRDPARKAFLSLIAPCNRVNKDGNMFQKAARLQELYQSKGNDIIAVVYQEKEFRTVFRDKV